MKELFEYKIRKRWRHVLVFTFLLGFIVSVVLGVEGIPFIVLFPRAAAVFFGALFLILFLVALLVYPDALVLTYNIKVRYSYGGTREIDFSEVNYYTFDKWPPMPEAVNLYLKGGKCISFFVDREDYPYLREYLESHKIFLEGEKPSQYKGRQRRHPKTLSTA